jgi:hypothetical protein
MGTFSHFGSIEIVFKAKPNGTMHKSMLEWTNQNIWFILEYKYAHIKKTFDLFNETWSFQLPNAKHTQTYKVTIKKTYKIFVNQTFTCVQNWSSSMMVCWPYNPQTTVL